MSTSVTVKLGVDSGSMAQGLRQATQKVDQFSRQASASSGTAAKAGGGIGGSILGGLTKLAGGLFVFDKIKDGIVGLVNSAGELVDKSDNLGIPIEKLQKMERAFGQSGVSADQFSKAISTLNQNIEAAKTGDEGMIANFEEFGITINDLIALSPDELMDRIADSVAKMGTASEKTAKLNNVLGKSGKAMVGAMSQGSQELRKIGEGAITVGEKQAKALDDLGDGAARIWQSTVSGATNALGTFVMAGKHLLTGGKSASPFTNDTKENPATRAERAQKAADDAKIKRAEEIAEMERIFAAARVAQEKKAREETERGEQQLHDKRMKMEEDMLQKADERSRKNMSLREKEKIDIREINKLLETFNEGGMQGDVAAMAKMEADQKRDKLVDEVAEEMGMTPDQRREARRAKGRAQRLRNRAERRVDRLIREGQPVPDALAGLAQLAPEDKMGAAATKFDTAADKLAGLTVVAITNT